MIHTKYGGWIVNCRTKQKFPFKRVGNTYVIDAWVKLPEAKPGAKDGDAATRTSPVFSRPSQR